jgi:hypothetical protein
VDANLTAGALELDMQRAINFFTPISTFTPASEKTDRSLDPAVLFSGICLAAFLVAIITGVQGVWL